MAGKREYYYQDDRSDKFWTVEVVGQTVITTYGRRGATPRETRKDLADPAAAERERDKLIAAKLREGYLEGSIDSVPARTPPDWASTAMSEEVFWRIIDLLNWRKTGDDDAVIEPAVKALAKMGGENVRRFADILAEKLYALDTRAHALEIGEYAYDPVKDYVSADWFLYVRCCVVANGKARYEQVLADPKTMLKDLEFEALLTIAPEAYERATGEEYDHLSPLSYETFSNREGWRR